MPWTPWFTESTSGPTVLQCESLREEYTRGLFQRLRYHGYLACIPVFLVALGISGN